MDNPSRPLIDFSDYDRYDALLADYQAGRLEDARFVGERLLMGVYGQRQPGLCMVRTKIPGGYLPVAHLSGYADALERFSRAKMVHITTRQDIQLHFVPLGQTAALQRVLGQHGIATREAGGNTVRNVVGCPLAGLCPAEHVDVGVYVRAVAGYFLRNPLTEAMPRKFKIGFSGCDADCAQAPAHDLTFVATRRNGQRGFRMFAGGGLGSKPRWPIVLDEFVEEIELLPTIEAVLALHDRHSDRKRKMRSRFKFLVEDFGAERLRELYRQEVARTRSAFDAAQAPGAQWLEPGAAPQPNPDAPRALLPQRQAGHVVVPVHVSHGDLTAAQLRGLHTLLTELRLTELRALVDQNLLVPNVPADKVTALVDGLKGLGLEAPRPGQNVVACPGTRTCQLGITSSQELARQLSGGELDLRIGVNGCQNSCARADLSDIGLYGKAKRHHGRIVPTYGLQLGGSPAGLACDGPEIPAARVAEAVRRIHDSYKNGRLGDASFAEWVRSQTKGFFEDLLADLTTVHPHELEGLLVDLGGTTLFRVESVGTGECAGVKLNPVEKLLLEVRHEKRMRESFVAKRKFEEAAESLEVMRSIGVRLLAHLDSEADLSESEALSTRIAAFLEQADELGFPALAADVDHWLDGLRGRNRAEKPSSGDTRTHRTVVEEG